MQFDRDTPVAFDATPSAVPRADAPRLSHARIPLLRPVEILDQNGDRRTIEIPIERPLTLYVDKRELVTLMTLGAAPELLALGYLLNQGLITGAGDVDSIDVDWEVSAAAVKTRRGRIDIAGRTAHRIVTTGCGQGTVFGATMAELEAVRLPPAEHARIGRDTLACILELERERRSVHRHAGSVHGCALYRGNASQVFTEDVGRHNAIDTIAGWMAVHGIEGGDKVFYTTGRLTSEMVMKAARMGVPIIVSRNGVTAMGHELAARLGMTLFGRAGRRQFLCYCGFERFDAESELENGPPVVVLAG
ncbi:MAG TPA: formate dehydrogenase accessory sulfurtransferase FdhD [Burkholderiaceae bacterium]|nr:formate dehydrogenase accessory sulfurtransferase FdhD [Burkholderiaceae bacterium]